MSMSNTRQCAAGGVSLGEARFPSGAHLLCAHRTGARPDTALSHVLPSAIQNIKQICGKVRFFGHGRLLLHGKEFNE